MNEKEFWHGDGGAEQEAQIIKELEDNLKRLRTLLMEFRELSRKVALEDYKRGCP